MPTIIIDDLTVRLASELQNTFNPTYAFGGKSHGGALALRETQTGHLLLPYDAEGNVIVTPGRRYQLVLVTERKAGQEHGGVPQQQQQQQQQQQRRKEVPPATEGRAEHTQPQEASKENEAVTAATNGEKRKRERKHKSDTPAPEEGAAAQQQQQQQQHKRERREKKETPRNGGGSNEDEDDDVPLCHVLANKSPQGVTSAVDAPAAPRRKASPGPPRLTAGDSPKTRATTRAPSNFSDDDNDNVPFSASYAKQQQQQQQPTVVSASSEPANQAEKPPSRRQPKAPRRAPLVTPSTSDSD